MLFNAQNMFPDRVRFYETVLIREERALSLTLTMFGPNRPAVDMEGNGEFWVTFEDFWRHS